jgi:hypothetical protein
VIELTKTQTKRYPANDELPDDQRDVIAYGDGGDGNRLMICQYYERKETWLLGEENGYLCNNEDIIWWIEMPVDFEEPEDV